MFKSILEDIKYQFRAGNTLTHIILINITVFVFINLIYVVTSFGSVSGIYTQIIKMLALPSGFPDFLIYFWTWMTHMFLHEGAWHLIWNMLILYWFGRIVGDFLGDNRVLPIYFLGGFAGALVYIITDQFVFLGTGGHSIALGASAATMAMVFTAAMVSPDFEMNLILLGRVKIKYIALALLLMDIFGTASQTNSGGHFAHLGGAFFGILYVKGLHHGLDVTQWMQNLVVKFGNHNKIEKTTYRERVPMEVVYNQIKSSKTIENTASVDFQEKLDEILDKINEVGIDNLTKEEREFLSKASKK